MKYKYIFYIFFIGIWILLRNSPQITETFYSRNIYPYIAKTLHFAFGWIPFSFGDVFYTILGGFAVYFVIKNRKKIWKKPIWFADKAFLFIFILFFCFFTLWGFNYFRISLSESLKIDTKYTKEALFQVTEKYILQANDFHKLLAENDSVKVNFQITHREIYEIAQKNFPLDIENMTDFSSFKSIKPSLYSLFLTYMGYSGYINPFTNEAQVNGKLIGYSTPITACHEIAHQMGYAAEEEANYIGYLAAKSSDNLYFKYSASIFALRYLLNEVYKFAPEKYEEMKARIRPGIFQNYAETRNFWKQYENRAEPVFKKSYDTFLKANKQQQGIESYNLVVGLLVNSGLKI
ncbi:DUF3810 domain-containing protein [Capnocytophaga felis]|uniref:Amino acid permease n=1 Tax=Capnocytophaga felis TaxID=2267611 RepID=A0A5M4B8H4_9FLAO|nr:DUF3810 domain-containing protein [Capnocytophaga felis]GET45904.1 hypothetical protein RCZ01_12060 [Capnocytophaga felis]GET49243.1 hypothetical protein RCZ02_20740 [Capnocytophaga felis]